MDDMEYLFILFAAGCDKGWGPIVIIIRFLCVCGNTSLRSACRPRDHSRLLQMPTQRWPQGSEAGKHIFTFVVKNRCCMLLLWSSFTYFLLYMLMLALQQLPIGAASFSRELVNWKLLCRCCIFSLKILHILNLITYLFMCSGSFI